MGHCCHEGFDLSSIQYSNDFEALSGFLGELESRVSSHACNAILMQRLVFSKSAWRNINNNRNRICDKLTDVYPKIPWKKIKIGTKPAWEFVNQLNKSVHSSEQTPGAAQYKMQVANRQGGEFCMLCGNRENLQVDHIIAVNTGGSTTKINNMQLLCPCCNNGKTNFVADDVRVALRVMDKECNQLRYRILFDHGKKSGESVIGYCQKCGLDASKTELEVVRASRDLSYAYANLKVECKENC
jgi:5-methylcytosine-specific restriction endonuclease McrA